MAYHQVMTDAIRINFSKPIPLFPLSGPVLLPHAILPLRIFEMRYRQMVNDCLDQAGFIAMASYESGDDAGGCGELRSAVCVGQIVQHEGLPDGRHNILLHGVCRARIVDVLEPDEERHYLLANLEPLEVNQADPPPMSEVRQQLRGMLMGPRLRRMRSVDTVMEWFDREDIPTHALLELIGFTLIKDDTLRYQLLAEADPDQRAELIKGELRGLDHLVRRAQNQSYTSWPKGMSWN